MVKVNISIDVPDLDPGVRFYREVFGFVEKARPFPTMAVLAADNVTLCVHAKSAGTRPWPGADDLRRYERHWTPVHLDLHVSDFAETLQRAQAQGAIIEQTFSEPKPAAFCSDPFGNGFCIIADD